MKLVAFLTLAFLAASAQSLQILGGEPLSSSAPSLSAQPHPSPPNPALWGPSMQAPYATNAWWENAVLEDGQQTVAPLPYIVQFRDDGLAVCLPGKTVDQNFIFTSMLDNLVLGSVEALGPRAVTRADQLSVTVAWSGTGMSAPVVQGMPYATVFYNGSTPALTTVHAVLNINDDADGEVTGTTFAISLNNEQTWMLYASEEITLTFAAGGSEITAAGQLDGWLRAGVASATSEGQVLDQYKDAIPIGGTVTGESDSDDSATYGFAWDYVGQGELLMMALPHHVDSGISSDGSVPDFTYNTMKGDMSGVVGATWEMSVNLPAVEWFNTNVDDDKRQDVIDALNGDLGQEVVAGDPYFGGKQMAKLARLSLIAEAMGETALASQYLDKVRPTLESWLDATNPDTLVYDSSWGGIVSVNGLADAAADFGMGYYNDHHFHFGYHVFAAAAVARADPAWGASYAAKVVDLVRDFAEPSDADAWFTGSRMKDWFAGHAWANGIQTAFADSHNQESTSESVNAWYAVALFGDAVGDARLKQLGQLNLATELQAAFKYWQITSADDIYPEPFASNKVVGILWATKVDYATWFGANVEFIHCIQMIPFVEATADLLRPEWIAEEYSVLQQAFNTASEEWRGYIIMAHAVIDKAAAWEEAKQLNAFDDGNTRSNTLYWIASR